VVALRDFIAARGYRPTADDIRRFRQDVATIDDGVQFGNLLTSPDFFNTSGCRDLCFHTQERRFTIPQIGSFLRDHALRFLGFHIDPQSLRHFRDRFPADDALTDLDRWHLFETENPRTFAAMYHFWTQKMQIVLVILMDSISTSLDFIPAYLEVI
jgi:hypothetical protein